jgi:hypothetical protein
MEDIIVSTTLKELLKEIRWYSTSSSSYTTEETVIRTDLLVQLLTKYFGKVV